MKTRVEFSNGLCPHEPCDAPIRFVFNERANTVSVYHGEDQLAEITTPPGTSVAATLEMLDQELEARESFTAFMGSQLALAVWDLHQGQEVGYATQ